jgi:hypothetical protein
MTELGHIARRLGYGLTAAGSVALAATGLTGWLMHGEVGGWLLVAHVLAGPVFTVGLLMLGATLAERCAGAAASDPADLSPGRRVSGSQRIVFWMVLALGLVSIVSVLGAMTPLFGYDGIKTLYAIHRISGIGLVGVVGIHVVLLAMSRRGR